MITRLSNKKFVQMKFDYTNGHLYRRAVACFRRLCTIMFCNNLIVIISINDRCVIFARFRATTHGRPSQTMIEELYLLVNGGSKTCALPNHKSNLVKQKIRISQK